MWRLHLQGREGALSAAGLMSVAVPLSRDGSISGAVYLSQPLSDLAAVLADLRGRLAISAAIALILSALVGLVLSRAIARPVRELTIAADRLAGGDFDYPLTTTSPEELAGLARSFGSMRDELRRTLQARTDLVTNVSHELRTPLTAIKGLTETLRDGAVDDLEARDRFLASIEGQTDRLIRLVNDLLLLSRADAQALALRFERLDLAEIASASVDELALAGGRAGRIYRRRRPARIRTRGRGPPAPGLHQPARQCPALLASWRHGHGARRSARATGCSPRSTTMAPAFLRATCRTSSSASTGAIDPAAPRPADDGISGSGLGLAIVQALVQAHGGTITVESAEGKGTTVRFILPAE